MDAMEKKICWLPGLSTHKSKSHYNRPRRLTGEIEVLLYSFFNLGTIGVDGRSHAAASLLPENIG